MGTKFEIRRKIVYSGLSLAEIMISICLLSIILLSIATIFPSGIEGIKIGKNMSLACNIANKHIELYKSNFYFVPKDLMAELYGGPSYPSIDPPSSIDGISFTPSVTVMPVPIGASFADPNEMVEVIVTVYWKQSSGGKKVKVTSYVFNRTYLPANVPVY
jgi:hypothetical protein